MILCTLCKEPALAQAPITKAGQAVPLCLTCALLYSTDTLPAGGPDRILPPARDWNERMVSLIDEASLALLEKHRPRLRAAGMPVTTFDEIKSLDSDAFRVALWTMAIFAATRSLRLRGKMYLAKQALEIDGLDNIVGADKKPETQVGRRIRRAHFMLVERLIRTARLRIALGAEGG